VSSIESQTSRHDGLASVALEFGLNFSAVSKHLRERFLALSFDAANEAFVEAALAAPHGRIRTWLHDLACRLAADFDVNGLLNMYPVHLLSEAQWQDFLPPEVAGGVHLDVGAGNGNLTQALQSRFRETLVTEASWAMRRRLRSQGFQTYAADLKLVPKRDFQLVSCLNVLDRTANPLTLLHELACLGSPGAWLVIAVPLPLNPFYYRGPFTFAPRQRLDAAGPVFEQALSHLAESLQSALPGWDLARLTRAPYLSWGDSNCSLYALDDAVLLYRYTGESAR
jgi:SAM-dependent methyltransferase